MTVVGGFNALKVSLNFKMKSVLSKVAFSAIALVSGSSAFAKPNFGKIPQFGKPVQFFVECQSKSAITKQGDFLEPSVKVIVAHGNQAGRNPEISASVLVLNNGSVAAHNLSVFPSYTISGELEFKYELNTPGLEVAKLTLTSKILDTECTRVSCNAGEFKTLYSGVFENNEETVNLTCKV